MRVLLFCTAILPAMLFAQNSAVRWSCLDMGYARTSASGWEIRSAAGQTFVSSASSGDTRITAGFMADTLLRGTVVSVSEEGSAPEAFALCQNYPNPFNPTTTIQFTIVNRQLTVVRVYDILGKEVATLLNEEKPPGTYSVVWNAAGAASGVYFYRIRAGDIVQTKRMLLLR